MLSPRGEDKKTVLCRLERLAVVACSPSSDVVSEAVEFEFSALESFGLPMKVIYGGDDAVLAGFLAKRFSAHSNRVVDMRSEMSTFPIGVQFEIDRSGILAG